MNLSNRERRLAVLCVEISKHEEYSNKTLWKILVDCSEDGVCKNPQEFYLMGFPSLRANFADFRTSSRFANGNLELVR